jgi:hypothetical protein
MGRVWDLLDEGASFSGEIRAGETFERPFGPGLIFRLDPISTGWTLTVRERDREEDLSRLTPPFRFVPNPRDIEGRHFRNSDNTGPNERGEKNVNAPGTERTFIFSPEVGRSIQGAQARAVPTAAEIEKATSYGRGVLRILGHRLNHLEPGKQARFDSMRFEVQLSWPAQDAPAAPPAHNPTPDRGKEGVDAGPNRILHGGLYTEKCSRRLLHSPG